MNMRKSIDTYIKAIAHDNEQEIRENYMTVADYIINDAESCTGYYEYFDDDELDETGEPTEAQIEELKAYLREHYTTPIEHHIEDVMLTKHHNGNDNLQYKADGKTYEVDGEFYVDKEYRLHHTHIFENGDEQEIVIPYKNGEHTLCSMREYTAKYDTNSMKGVEYSFKAKNLQEAIKFAQYKFFAYPNIEIYDDTDTVKACTGPLVFGK